MAGKEIDNKRYVVRLSAEERARLEAFVSKGKRSAQLLRKARILLKADVSEAGGGWSDVKIAEALDTSAEKRGRFPLIEGRFAAMTSGARPSTSATNSSNVSASTTRPGLSDCEVSTHASVSRRATPWKDIAMERGLAISGLGDNAMLPCGQRCCVCQRG